MPPKDSSEFPAVWHGSPEEMQRLEASVRRHCTCAKGRFGNVTRVCSAHTMLLDQRVLDHLLYVYRTKARFERAEWEEAGGAWGGSTATGSSGGQDYTGGWGGLTPHWSRW